MQVTPHVVLSVVAAVVSTGVAVVAWRHREAPGGTSMAGFGAAAAVWTAGNAVQAASTTLDGKLLAIDVQYLGVVAIPVAWFAFACEYTGRRSWLDRRTLVLLAAQPVLTLALVWTNDAHHLVRIGADLVTVGGVVAVERSFGSWFWVTQTYSYVLLGLGTLLLLREVVTGHRPFRSQVVAILVGATVPWVAQTAFLNDLTRLEPEVFFSVTGVAFTYAVVRHRLLDVVPIARDGVIAALDDGVVVLDGDGRVVDCNPTAHRLLGPPGSVVGRPADEALAGHPTLRRFVDAAADGDEPSRADLGDGVETVAADVDGEVRQFVPQALRIDDADGLVVHLRDVTGLKRRERDLEARNRRLDRVASRIAHDLRNPLTVAGGNLELARETGDLDSLEKVHAAHERMATIVEDVLSEARGAERDQEAVDLAAAAREAWENVATPDARLAVDGSVTVVAGRTRLLTLLENLFRNAVEHGAASSRPEAGAVGEHAGGDVTVTVGSLADGFYVADDGAGIPAASRNLVFERGYTTGDGDTGIGLTIVSAVAEEHGWEVAIADADGGGTRVEVTGVRTA